jgi:hypothetical protein
MKDEFVKNIGVWGQRHYAYLKKHSPTVINVMRMNGTLEKYLRDIDQDASEMFDKMMKAFAEFEGVTEQLKSDNQLEWVGRMNNIRARVTNIVNAELIYYLK